MRQTQIETLELAATVPDVLLVSDVAHQFGRSIRASEQRLERLVRSGHLRMVPVRWDRKGMIPCYSLTERGRAVVREAE